MSSPAHRALKAEVTQRVGTVLWASQAAGIRTAATRGSTGATGTNALDANSIRAGLDVITLSCVTA